MFSDLTEFVECNPRPLDSPMAVQDRLDVLENAIQAWTATVQELIEVVRGRPLVSVVVPLSYSQIWSIDYSSKER